MLLMPTIAFVGSAVSKNAAYCSQVISLKAPQ
jgi:hypothetical protein